MTVVVPRVLVILLTTLRPLGAQETVFPRFPDVGDIIVAALKGIREALSS